MKYKKIFVTIYAVLLLGFFVSFIILAILGNKSRIGYLGELKLNLENTCYINNLNFNDIENMLLANNELNYNSLLNYILTNDNVTNYFYSFKLSYYDKIFRNSDIYGVYVDTNKIMSDNNFIKKMRIDEGGSPFGQLISDKRIDSGKIDNINYKLKVKGLFAFNFILIAVSIFIIFFKIFEPYINNNILYKTYIKYEQFINNNFVFFISIVGVLLFILHFWSGFPGYYSNPDNLNIMQESVTANYTHAHPVIIKAVLNSLYKIFGYNTYYLFLFNTLFWYLGLSLIIISIYLKFHKKKVILLFLLSFIQNINITLDLQLKDAGCSMFFWLAYSIIFFTILFEIKNNTIKNIIYIIISLLLLFGFLWRHNAIVTVYPIGIYFVYLFLKNKKMNIQKYILSFSSLMIILALLLISIYKFYPLIFIKSENQLSKNVTNHLFFLQIAGCAVPANDSALIPDDWYIDGKNFDDLKETYCKNMTYADILVNPKYGIFINDENEQIKIVWIKSIIKHPINYIKHIINFSKYMIIEKIWSSYPTLKLPMVLQNLNVFKDYKIPYEDKKTEFYTFFSSNLIAIPTIYFILILLVVFILSVIFMFKFKYFTKLIVFAFSTSLSGIFTFIIACLFNPVINYRYIFPILPISMISFIALIVFIYDIGGLKKIKIKLGKNK